MNPFEQLRFCRPQPKQAFAEVVTALLRGRLGPGVHAFEAAEGRIRVAAPPGSPHELTLYQTQYCLRRWQSIERKQIRAAFEQALREERLPWRWVLCVPSRTSSEDLRWFASWRPQPATQVDILDGNELVALLRAPGGARALATLRGWGVTVPGEKPARVHGRLRVRAAAAHSGLTHYLYVSLHNGGGTAVDGLRVELAHSATGCVGLQADPSHWAPQGQRELNPRTLAARRPLLAQEERLVAVIPVGAQTPLPMGLRVRFSTEQTALVEEHLWLDQQALAPVERLDFGAGAGPELILAEVS